MSRLLVDHMPIRPEQCPLAQYETTDDGLHLCACKGGKDYCCSLDYGASCDYLEEFKNG